MIKDEELLSVDRKYLNHRGRKAADLAQIIKDYAERMNCVPATDDGITTVLSSLAIKDDNTGNLYESHSGYIKYGPNVVYGKGLPMGQFTMACVFMD